MAKSVREVLTPNGMLARADVSLEAKEKKVGETVEQISQRSSRERE